MSGALHLDTGKPPLGMVPRSLLIAVAQVLEFGEKKYERWNWTKGSEFVRFANSALRHIYAWLEREDKDPESGLSHLHHAATNLAFLIEWMQTGAGKDDRKPLLKRTPVDEAKEATTSDKPTAFSTIGGQVVGVFPSAPKSRKPDRAGLLVKMDDITYDRVFNGFVREGDMVWGRESYYPEPARGLIGRDIGEVAPDWFIYRRRSL